MYLLEAHFREKKLHTDANGERYRLKIFFLFILYTFKESAAKRSWVWGMKIHSGYIKRLRRRRSYVHVKALFSPTIAFPLLLCCWLSKNMFYLMVFTYFYTSGAFMLVWKETSELLAFLGVSGWWWIFLMVRAW